MANINMIQYTSKKQLILHMYIFLDATRRGWLEDSAVSNFTRAMLVGGDIVLRHGGNKLRQATEDTFRAWLAAADKADSKGMNRIVCSGDQYKIAAKFVATVDKLLSRVTDADVEKSTKHIDGQVYC